jgi:hypothetical protein
MGTALSDGALVPGSGHCEHVGFSHPTAVKKWPTRRRLVDRRE